MKKIIIFMICPLFIFSQDNQLPYSYISIDEYKSINIEYNTQINIESNTINTKFLNSMLFGGYIDDTLKDKWINNTTLNNTIHSHFSNRISFFFSDISSNKHPYSIGFSIIDKRIINTNFSDDIMKLILYGNYHYQNETLNFSNTNFRIDMFQQYKINYIISLYKLKINTGFSFLSGNYHSSYLINKGALYTGINGNYLDLNYDLYSISTHLSDNIFERNGNGLALEFLFKYTIKDYKLNIYIEDLGFIMWNPESISTSSDSNFTFNGIQVENILNFNDSILEQYNNIDNIIKQENTSFKTYTPANFGVSIQRKTQHFIFQKISAGINIKWQPHYEISNTSFWDLRRKIKQGIDESNYTPLIWASNIYKYKDLNIISNLSYGGYTGTTNIGLAVAKGNKKKVIIGGNNLQELLDINNIKAIGIHFSFLIHL